MLLELVEDILDGQRCSLTAWELADRMAIEGAIGNGGLPTPLRQQDYFQGSRLMGRCYYFWINRSHETGGNSFSHQAATSGELAQIQHWLAETQRKHVVKDLQAELAERRAAIAAGTQVVKPWGVKPNFSAWRNKVPKGAEPEQG